MKDSDSFRKAKTLVECAYCSKKVSAKREMEIHEYLIHEGKKDFECNECCKKFGLNHNLIRHMKTVHKRLEKAIDSTSGYHECNKCSRKYMTNQSLQRHVETVISFFKAPALLTIIEH